MSKSKVQYQSLTVWFRGEEGLPFQASHAIKEQPLMWEEFVVIRLRAGVVYIPKNCILWIERWDRTD